MTFAAVLVAASIIPQAAWAAWFTLGNFSGQPANTISVWGGGFQAGEEVRISGGTASFDVRATEFGDLSPASFTIPVSAPQGNFSITATGLASGFSAGNIYYVQPFSPSILIAAQTNTPGATIRISGGPFAPNETVILGIASSTASAVADLAGMLSAAPLTIPQIPPGTYRVTARGASSGAEAGEYLYVNRFYPGIVPSAYYIVPGGILSWSGHGFAAGEKVDILVASNTSTAVMASVFADASGSFSGVSFEVPFSFAGRSETFRVRGDSSGAIAEATIAIGRLYPFLIPSEYYVTPGSTISFTGGGFAPNETIRIFMGSATGTQIAAQASEEGRFSSSTIAIPHSLQGTNLLFWAVGDRSGAEGSVSVAIGALYPNILPSAYYLPAGYSLTISGTGFAPDEEILFFLNGEILPLRSRANNFGNFFLAGPFQAPVTPGAATFRAQGASSFAATDATITVGRLYPTVTPTEYWLMPLQSLEFRGSGFMPEEQVMISLGTSTLGVAQANGFGNFLRTVNAPARSGPVEYVFTGQTSGAEARLALTVAGLYPNVTAQNYYVAPGAELYVQGAGYLNNENVEIRLNGSLAATVAANAVGNVRQTAVTLPIASGAVEVRMTGLLSGATAATFISLIPWSPLVLPNTWWSAGGTPLIFSGTGFAPGEGVRVSVNGTTTVVTPADSSGSFNLSGLALPFTPPVARYLFTGETSGASASFEIGVAALYPWMFLNTYYGPAGAPLTVSGRGFAPNESVAITAEGTEFGRASADAAGAFDFLTRMPHLPIGDKAIMGTGALSRAVGTTGFTIAPIYLSLFLERYVLPPSAGVTFIGSGYLPGETIHVTTDRTGTSTVYAFNAGPEGSFRDAGFILAADMAEGGLTVTLTGEHSLVPKSITLYVTKS